MLVGNIGEIVLHVLFVVVIISLAIHLAAIFTGRTDLRKWSRYSMTAQFLLVATASTCLIWLLVRGNLSYAYVVQYTSAGLSLIYKIAAFWGGDAGSLLFWSLVLTMYGMVVAFSRHPDSHRMLPIVSLIVTGVTFFYTTLLNVGVDPFLRLPKPAAIGDGLNPLLQNPGMTVHPVNVYLGYVGFTIPYAYAMAGLILNKTDATWLRVTRRWTLISWLFLGVGIIYGAHWSYEELGWGGYWAWDPVENAALLPWVTATAFLHSSIVQERKGMLKAWNVVLVTLTYFLSLLGTYLVRSGVLWSIHAFANGLLGTYYLVFMAIIFVFSVVLMILRWPSLRPERRFEAVVSKETGFMLNNILFLGVTFAVLWGTVFPLVSEAATGHKMMVSAPFYNAVALPLAVCIIFLMGIGPMIAWRRASVQSVVRAIVVPMLVAVALGLAVTAALRAMYTPGTSLLSTLGIISAFYALITVGVEYVRSVCTRMEFTGDAWFPSLLRLLNNKRSRFGGYLVHVAIAVIALGIVGSGAYQIHTQQTLNIGGTAKLGPYEVRFVGLGVGQGQAGTTRRMYANLLVSRNGQTLGVLRPAATFYANGQSPTTDVALYSRPMRDLYVVMLGTEGQNKAIFDIHVNPMVQFIWFGGYLFIFGTLISLWPAKRKKADSATDSLESLESWYEELADLEYDRKMGKVDKHAYVIQKNELLAHIEAAQEHAKQLQRQLRSEVDEALLHLGMAENAGGTNR
ncbi:heme lyase CcmF/NrfE family subunit [Alicyclobacillus curvatus]|nr:heme lyase CcmF/NrfE family subunit [Alicyclobacillus curvatus]